MYIYDNIKKITYKRVIKVYNKLNYKFNIIIKFKVFNEKIFSTRVYLIIYAILL